ncbi:MAG: hypothetical protein OZSIB_2141 [Candidatus Ozemobacter sibiricus]|jgi:hypothetical protein|uniref:Prepilin-type N-terminal cleavage/methylation domain-containing protein n=1 Tax=Candidatus Ozemobacter sibiricus TaxID=2268124 RepID=A0A367ZV93_9BACT|nr:MAG: hypothetical protein OZSIB_2141 [Candidatus Ozemobacter sibiricus]
MDHHPTTPTATAATPLSLGTPGRPRRPSDNLPLGHRGGRHGASLIEVLLAFVFLSTLLSLFVYAFYFSGKTQRVTEQLDAFHEARMVDYALSSEIKFSTGILYPLLPEDGSGPSPTVHQVIFRDPLNRVKAVFLTPEKDLVLIDYDRIVGNRLAPPRVLGRNVEKFEVTLLPTRVVEYRARFKIGTQDHEIVNQILPVNQF